MKWNMNKERIGVDPAVQDLGEIMDENQGAASGRAKSDWADFAIRLALMALVVYWSFLLLRPFIAILIWAAILSVALYPIYIWVKRVLGGRSTLASFLLTLLVLVIILGPIGLLGAALVENLSSIAARISEGTVTVPPPPPYVADWPIIGNKLSSFWQAASVELGRTLASIKPQLEEAALKLLGLVGNIGLGVLQFTVAIIIAGFTYSRAAAIQDTLKIFAARAASQMGEDFVDLAGGTVRGVARGVVGISLIQAILFGIGALVAGIPRHLARSDVGKHLSPAKRRRAAECVSDALDREMVSERRACRVLGPPRST